MSMLSTGMRVVKVREYKPGVYCKYGGEERHVPLGTCGKVLYYEEQILRVNVQFDNGIQWSVDASELKIPEFRERYANV